MKTLLRLLADFLYLRQGFVSTECPASGPSDGKVAKPVRRSSTARLPADSETSSPRGGHLQTAGGS